MAVHNYHHVAQNDVAASAEPCAQLEVEEPVTVVRDAASATEVNIVPDSAPPQYTETASAAVVDVTNAKLPTYEEYEKEHENDDEFDTNLPEEFTMADSANTRGHTAAVIEGLDLALGDDFTLCCTLLLSFFLNWIGFLLAYFFSRTIAGKCGATAGFGLGLIKLAFLLRRSDHLSDNSGAHGYAGWFVWVMVLFGWFTFVRGITLYLRYKRDFEALQQELSNV